jgi:hypothetical protein
VAEAHALCLIHRDLKPHNLFLTRHVDGRPLVKVLDFGLAKSVTPGTDEPRLTTSSVIMGSPAYMSPEQLGGTRNLDGRTDVWSLGVCLYELLTARLPFEADTAPALCASILTGAPRALTVEGDAQGVAEVIQRCLEKDPARRFADVGELAAALAPYAGAPASRPSAERVAGVLAATQRADSSQPQVGVSQGSWAMPVSKGGAGASAARRWIRVAIVVACAGLLVGAVLYELRSKTAPATARPAPVPSASSETARATASVAPSVAPPASQSIAVATASVVGLPRAPNTGAVATSHGPPQPSMPQSPSSTPPAATAKPAAPAEPSAAPRPATTEL